MKVPLWGLMLAGIVGCGSRAVEQDAAGARPSVVSPTTVAINGGTPLADGQPGDVKTSSIRFRDVARESGVDFTYYGSPSQSRWMTEHNGGGIATADFDGDGIIDVFLSNGSRFDHQAQEAGESNRLFRNDGQRFDDVTEAAWLESFGFGQGCAAGDFDNDGFTDLFLAGYRGNRFWKNLGDGTFEEITEAAGLNNDKWNTSAAFADLNADGLLDLYVASFVDWNPELPGCSYPGHPELPVICSPKTRPPQPDSLLLNLGDGRFSDQSIPLGIAASESRDALALQIADLDHDGRLDVFVANDEMPNSLFLATGENGFEEAGLRMGVAFSSDGSAGASMGVACQDYSGDGEFDLAVTNFRHQVNDLLSGLGDAGFVPQNSEAGLDAVSRPMLGWGIAMNDFDSDSWPDLVFANGHIFDLTSLGSKFEYQMRPSILRNINGTRFESIADSAGDYFQQEWLGRAVAVADLDNDRDLDLVIQHIDAPCSILKNDSDRTFDTVSLRLIGVISARQPLGCRVEVEIAGRVMTALVASGGSFQVSHDPRVLVTTNGHATIDRLRLTWPDSQTEEWRGLVVPEDRELTLIEGTGVRTARQKIPTSQ